VRVSSLASLRSLTGFWLEHKIFFRLEPKSGDWYGFAGAGLTIEPGEYALALEGITASKQEVVVVQQVLHVAAETYPTVTLTVQGKFTAPSARQQARIERESKLKKMVFAHSAGERLWSGGFVAPVGSTTSEGFGVKRVFNGEVKSRHQGLDYRAARGTPVTATNSGTVVLARNLFFEGGCVILDHGQGLMTLYMHLSRILVKPGQSVRKRQRLGLSGASGRATGPHLHLAVRWEGTYLDPAKVLSLHLPATGE
jgi:murein DD-endopeptidase MepM/ murein hydrolase activator NlpD